MGKIIFLHSYIPTFLHSYIPTFLHSYNPRILHSYIPTFLHSYIPTFLHSYNPTILHSYIPTFLHSYIPAGDTTNSEYIPVCRAPREGDGRMHHFPDEGRMQQFPDAKNHMERGHPDKRTWRLYDQIGPVGRFDENSLILTYIRLCQT